MASGDLAPLKWLCGPCLPPFFKPRKSKPAPKPFGSGPALLDNNHQILMRRPVMNEVVSTLVFVPAKPNLAPGVPGKPEARPLLARP